MKEELLALLKVLKEIPKEITAQISRWDVKVNTTIAKMGVIVGQTYKVTDYKEAVKLLEATSGRRIIGGHLIVELPAGTFNAGWQIDLHDAGAGRTVNRVILRGAGKDKTFIANSVLTDRILYLNNSKMTIEHLTIDSEDRERETILLDSSSELILSSKTVKIKNSNASYAIRVQQGSRLFASYLEFSNCSGGLYAHSQAYVDLNYATFSANQTVKQASFVTAYVNSEVNFNHAKVNGNNKLYHGVLCSYNSRCYGSYSEIRDVTYQGYLAEYNSVLVAEHSIVNANCHHGVRATSNSVVRARFIIFEGMEKGVYANSGSEIFADDTQYRKIKELSCHADSAQVWVARMNSEVLEDAYHFHLDKSNVYTKEAVVRGGKQLASIHYNSCFQLYDSKDMKAGNKNYVNVSGMSIFQDSGSTVTSNVENGKTLPMYGTRF